MITFQEKAYEVVRKIPKRKISLLRKESMIIKKGRVVL